MIDVMLWDVKLWTWYLIVNKCVFDTWCSVIDEGLVKGRGKDFVLREDANFVQINEAKSDYEGKGQRHGDADGEG